MGPTQQQLQAAELDLSSFYHLKPDDSTSFPSLFYDDSFPSNNMSSLDSSTGDTPDSGSLSPSSPTSINLMSDTPAIYQKSNKDLSSNVEKRKATPSIEEKVTKAPKTTPAKKAGRKPNVTERASKRKEQNRAAQRAFRERKEKHLQDLEDRIAELETETTTATSENEFLKDQVKKLQDELKRYQASRSSTSTVLQTPYSNFTFEFPFYKNPKSTNMSSARSSSNNSLQSTPDSLEPTSLSHLGSVSSISSSPEQTFSSGKTGVDKFCDELNLACGNRENPIPRDAGVKPPYISSLSVLPNTEEPIKLGDKPTFVSPPAFEIDFLSDYRDPIFDEEEFNMPEITTEISAFDPLEPFLQGTDPGALYPSSLAAPVATKAAGMVSIGAANNEDEETVPARSETFLPCHAVWDKISAHPKFGEIDINGLCAELRTKARCSTTGAVMSEQDVKHVLSTIGV